jgi:hypothetical protein
MHEYGINFLKTSIYEPDSQQLNQVNIKQNLRLIKMSKDYNPIYLLKKYGCRKEKYTMKKGLSA